jgi:hypothetical protein
MQDAVRAVSTQACVFALLALSLAVEKVHPKEWWWRMTTRA